MHKVMGRGYAKNEFNESVKGNRMGIFDCGSDIVDKIYNDVDNRFCKNCRQNIDRTSPGGLHAQKGCSLGIVVPSQLDKDTFSCNEWSLKQ